ncbi:MAG TPA: EamA family transporter [Usitatibacter sp.]|nr:EamA family transporter [Usitatibacter sp.]
MKWTDFLLALAVMAVWGTNFVVIDWGLREFPPLLFACLRFFFSAVPALLFLRRPATPWRYLVGYGVLLGAGQFGLLFLAMNGHITPGLASLIIQMQVIFTIVLSVLMFGERVSTLAIVGTLLAVAGLATVGAHLDATVTPKGLVLILFAAFCWGCANVVVKLAAKRGPSFNMLAFIVWSSVFAVPPLLLLSLVFEGTTAVEAALRHATTGGWLAVAWQALGNTLFCFAVWSRLLHKYDAAIVTPYALLVPVFGMGASALMLGEPMPPWKLVAGAMVLGGIAVITLGPLLRRR